MRVSRTTKCVELRDGHKRLEGYRELNLEARDSLFLQERAAHCNHRDPQPFHLQHIGRNMMQKHHCGSQALK